MLKLNKLAMAGKQNLAHYSYADSIMDRLNNLIGQTRA